MQVLFFKHKETLLYTYKYTRGLKDEIWIAIFLIKSKN
jgi:hypothetical protein